MKSENTTNEPATPPAAPEPAVPKPRGAAGGEAAGGVYSNTPPSNHQNDSLTTGGEDWLELSLYCQHGDFERLSKRLDIAKLAAEEGRSPRDELLLNGERFRCLPGTARAGKKGNPISYRWRLESECGIILLLMNRAEPHASMPNAMIRATSLPLLRHGTLGCYCLAIRAFAAMQIDVESIKLTRVDLCVDWGGQNVTPFCTAYETGRYVGRPRRSCRYFAETTVSSYRLDQTPLGFSLGSEGTQLRVYDKHREMLHSPEKFKLMLNRRYGNPVYEATRVEFQLRRGKLKQLGVNSLGDWFEKRGAVAEYLTHEWIRLTACEVDRQHPERAATLPEWVTVQERFAEWCGKSEEVTLAPLQTAPPNIDHLRQQCVGLLTSILVHERRSVSSNDDFVNEAMDSLLEAVEGRLMAAEFRERASKLKVPLSELNLSDNWQAGNKWEDSPE